MGISRLGGVAGVLGGVAVAGSAVAATQRFETARDMFVDRGTWSSAKPTLATDGAYKTLGTGTHTASYDYAYRAFKFTQFRYLADFDVAAVKTYIEGQIGRPVDDVGDLADVEFHWKLLGRYDPTNYAWAPDATGYVGVYRMTGDWDEATSSYAYASGTSGTTGTAWVNASGTTMANFLRAEPGGTSSSNIATISGDASTAQVWSPGFTAGDPSTQTVEYTDANSNVVRPFRDWLVSDDLAFMLLTDPQAVGLTLVPTAGDNNGQIYSREAIEERRPYLEVVVNTPVPEPASLGLLALGGLALVRRRAGR